MTTAGAGSVAEVDEVGLFGGSGLILFVCTISVTTY